MNSNKYFILLFFTGFMISCTFDVPVESEALIDFQTEYPNIYATFSGSANLDLDNLPDYSNQTKPSYIANNLDNSLLNPITDRGALLGRVLFYDNKLSTNNTVSCSTCHSQADAFSDTASVSTGVNGVTGRHSMRLVNTRWAREDKFFWDERAASLELQTTEPIKDHNEMGFSRVDPNTDFSDLILKLEGVSYYPEFFQYVFGSSEITELKIQNALGQFIRSIQSFDSKYDAGRITVNNENQNFANFTTDENIGKNLFLNPPQAGGAGCAGCHTPPAFDIDPNSLSNGVVGVFGSLSTDTTVTRSPSLRDLFKQNGNTNGSFMHDASFSTIEEVIAHYNNGITLTANLDPRLMPGGNPQNLGLTSTEINQLVLFLKTLSGTDMYTNPKWSTPF